MEEVSALKALVLAQQRELEACRPIAEWFRKNRVYATFDQETLTFCMVSSFKGVEECILTIAPMNNRGDTFTWKIPSRVFIPVSLFIPVDSAPEIWRLLVQQDYQKDKNRADGFRINFASKEDKAWISGGKLIQELPLDQLLDIEAKQIVATLEQAAHSWRLQSAAGASLLRALPRSEPMGGNRIDTELWQL